MTEGLEAIQRALDNPTLKPHYALIEAKRLASNFGKRKADPVAALKVLDKHCVLSGREISWTSDLIKSAAKEKKDSKAIKTLAGDIEKRLKQTQTEAKATRKRKLEKY